MKKTLRLEFLLTLAQFLAASKYNKMQVSDRTVVLVNLRKLRDLKKEFDKEMKQAGQDLMPEGYKDRLDANLKIEQEAAMEFGKIDSREKEKEFVEKLKNTYPDYALFIEERNKYIAECDKVLKERASKEVEIDIDKLTEKGFEALMSSNDWNFDQAEMMHDFLCVEDDNE